MLHYKWKALGINNQSFYRFVDTVLVKLRLLKSLGHTFSRISGLQR